MSFFNELKRRNVFRVGIAYTVAAWLLLQVTDIVFPRIGLPDSAVTLVIALLAIGFIPALIFAWAFEMTPEGIKKEADIDRSKSITPQTGRKLDRMIIGVMAVVIAFLIVDRFLLSEDTGEAAQTVEKPPVTVEEAKPQAETGPSIAVLPFVNMSGDANNEYFSDGLTETLLHMLAQIPELRVAARTSSFAFKGKNTSIEEISTALGVAHILEGSVQKAGNRVRVTAQLIRADDGFHVWSQNYDRTLEDIFAIQDEIAEDVADALGASLLGTTGIALQGVSTNSTAAFDLYLKALEQQATASYGSLGTAEGLLKNALATDPGFIEAKYALIRNYMAKRRTGLIDQPTALQSIEPLVQQVKAERPQDPLPRAFELIVDSSDLYNLARGVKRDVIINEILTLLPRIPSDTFVREVVAMHLRRNNAFEEALGVLKAGLMLDPLSTNLHHELSHLYLEMERYEDAQSTLMRGIEIAPDFPAFYSDLSDLARETGDINAALNWKRKGIEKDPQDHELAAELASTLFLLGLTEEGARWADRCYALAAHTTVCRLTQLEQASANNDEARRLLLAESMLRDNVDSRRGGFHRALVSYADLMTEKGQAREAWDFLKSTFPGMDAHGQPPESMKLLDVRRSGVELMAWFEPADRFNSALDQLIETERTANLRWLGSTRYRLENHLLRGEIDQALTIALEEDLNQVITMMLDYRHRYATPLYRELSQIPEVAARLREIDAETSAMSEQVRVAMLEPEWNQ